MINKIASFNLIMRVFNLFSAP